MIPEFERGVRFGCTACGKCCTMLRSDLALSHADVTRVSAHLNLTVRSFVAKYCTYFIDIITDARRTVRMPWIALRVPKSGWCVFLRDDRCSIHEVKPFICSHSPFMAYVAEGQRSVWREALSYCPGIGEGERYSPERIRELLKEETDEETGDFDRLEAHGGSLERVFRTRLPRPIIREVRLAADRTTVSVRERKNV